MGANYRNRLIMRTCAGTGKNKEFRQGFNKPVKILTIFVSKLTLIFSQSRSDMLKF